MSGSNKTLSLWSFALQVSHGRGCDHWNVNLAGTISSQRGWSSYPLKEYLEPEILRFDTLKA